MPGPTLKVEFDRQDCEFIVQEMSDDSDGFWRDLVARCQQFLDTYYPPDDLDGMLL